MIPDHAEAAALPVTFGQRRIKPRVGVVDRKQHIRAFLGEALEDFGFMVSPCGQAAALGELLDTQAPDLLILGLSGGGVEACAMLEVLATRRFRGKVLLLGAPGTPMVNAIQELGEKLALEMLPVLATPFSDESLRTSLAALLPVAEPPRPAVDAGEALKVGWLELWYQPKIDSRSLALTGAEALVRMRHPSWGIVPPAYFIPAPDDPHFRALSEFVVSQAIRDWHYFIGQHGRIELAVNLPLAFLQRPEAIHDLVQQMPEHPIFEGIVVELTSADVVGNLPLACEIASQLRFHNIGVSIDDLGAEWPALLTLDSFPFVEIKLDQKFVTGCADNSLQRAACRQIVDFASELGVRTVAEGVETRGDYLTMRDLGVDQIQGFLFAKPMPPRKFLRQTLGQPGFLPN